MDTDPVGWGWGEGGVVVVGGVDGSGAVGVGGCLHVLHLKSVRRQIGSHLSFMITFAH